MKYLAKLSDWRKLEQGRRSVATGRDVLGSWCVSVPRSLENAKTNMNDNSSIRKNYKDLVG